MQQTSNLCHCFADVLQLVAGCAWVCYSVCMKYPLLSAARAVRKEAAGLLKATSIEAELAQYGEANLIGSYAYDVMVARDIDFHVIMPQFDLAWVQRFFAYATNSGMFEYISLHDKHRFNKEAAARYPSNWALDSYYFGLRLPFAGHEWQIGVNFLTQLQEASLEIGRLFESVTDTQREQIVDFKMRLQTRGVKVSSAYVYRAVIQEAITGFDELLAYLSGLGYSF